MAESHIEGVRNLRRVARELRDEANVGLRRELDKGMLIAVRPLAQEVHTGLGRYIPSGFRPTLDRVLRVLPRLHVRAGRVSVRATAKGGTEKRDLAAMNRGQLRHPVFGRTRRIKRHAVFQATSLPNPWVEQRIKPGFFSDPARRLRARVVDEASAALGRVVDRINGKA